MRAKEIITETVTVEHEEMASFIRLVKKHCQPFLQEAGSRSLLLSRGMKTQEDLLKKNVRLENRTPTDTPKSIHDFMNEYFVEHFGSPFRNAMFCTGSAWQAEEYGKAFIIFPIGNFEYVWSANVQDLYEQLTHTDDLRLPAIKKGLIDFDETQQDLVDTVLHNAEYSGNRLKAAIDSGNEIMLRCKSYYAVSKRALTEYGIENIHQFLDFPGH